MSQVQTTENLDKLAYTRFRKQPVGFSQWKLLLKFSQKNRGHYAWSY
jgi:hypothetical protein